MPSAVSPAGPLASNSQEAARTARRLSDPGWRGEKGQGRWQAKKLLEWAAEELTLSRRDNDIELEFGLWRHTGLVPERGGREEDEELTAEVAGVG